MSLRLIFTPEAEQDLADYFARCGMALLPQYAGQKRELREAWVADIEKGLERIRLDLDAGFKVFSGIACMPLKENPEALYYRKDEEQITILAMAEKIRLQ
jgi:hypothetical protein